VIPLPRTNHDCEHRPVEERRSEPGAVATGSNAKSIGGAASYQVQTFPGKAEPFRTSSGRAATASLRTLNLRRFMLNYIARCLKHGEL
jgi:hypothetical protein